MALAPAPNGPSPYFLIPPGTPNTGLVGNQIGWSTLVGALTGGIPAAYVDMVNTQYIGFGSVHTATEPFLNPPPAP